MPTNAPTAEPFTPEPPTVEPFTPLPPTEQDSTPPPPAADLVLTGTAVKSDYGSDGASCDVSVNVQLTIKPDGKAYLTATGPDITDHYNCTSTGEETWYLEGTADAANQTVSFAACNFGGFTAQGSLSYAGQALSGTSGCLSSDGKQAVRLVFGD